jgi:surface antigen
MRRGLFAAVAAGFVFASAPAVAQSPLPLPQSHGPRTETTLPGPDFRASLDDMDELAVLDAIHVALATVGDGSSYVWHRNHGRLSGIMQPTASFRAPDGAPCRHLVIMLVAGRYVQKAEGIACRGADKRWTLSG